MPRTTIRIASAAIAPIMVLLAASGAVNLRDQNEAARAAVLASLATVDCVTVFDEETPLELIRLFQPEVLVKGADYTVETVVGADIVQGYGGQVRLAQLLPGNSTTATVARMKG
jgi:D-beta-D-heptose 7-phosphate kinase/D-beta-D-heptose 1-phosphate adenosyltransferase